jgi:hypothetical protein
MTDPPNSAETDGANRDGDRNQQQQEYEVNTGRETEAKKQEILKTSTRSKNKNTTKICLQNSDDDWSTLLRTHEKLVDAVTTIIQQQDQPTEPVIGALLNLVKQQNVLLDTMHTTDQTEMTVETDISMVPSVDTEDDRTWPEAKNSNTTEERINEDPEETTVKTMQQNESTEEHKTPIPKVVYGGADTDTPPGDVTTTRAVEQKVKMTREELIEQSCDRLAAKCAHYGTATGEETYNRARKQKAKRTNTKRKKNRMCYETTFNAPE